jgi:hypothetical protein
MWLMLNDAFLSVVDKSNAPDCLLVRARRPEHLAAVFPNAEIRESFGTDYRFRADIDRREVAQIIASRIAGIDYDNFKNSVQDDALHTAYMGVWTVMGRLQKGGPYSRDVKRRKPMDDHWNRGAESADADVIFPSRGRRPFPL